MYEICRLLAANKVAKVRKPHKASIAVGKAVTVFAGGARAAVIVSKHTSPGCWIVRYADGREGWANRNVIEVA